MMIVLKGSMFTSACMGLLALPSTAFCIALVIGMAGHGVSGGSCAYKRHVCSCSTEVAASVASSWFLAWCTAGVLQVMQEQLCLFVASSLWV